MEISAYLEKNETNYYNNYENLYMGLKEKLEKNSDSTDPFFGIKEKFEKDTNKLKEKSEDIIIRLKIFTDELNSLKSLIFKFLDDKVIFSQNDYLDLEDELSQSKKYLLNFEYFFDKFSYF